ncbi:MAG: diacylglycerol kinase [Pseudomonadales bacterium]
MKKPGLSGFKRLIAATEYSFKGLAAAWKCEEAFRMEIVLFVLLVPTAFWLGRSLVEQIVLILVCVLVIVAELINTALESVVDRISHQLHPLSGQAKDLGSAIVFVATLTTITVWGLVVWDRFIA